MTEIIAPGVGKSVGRRLRAANWLFKACRDASRRYHDRRTIAHVTELNDHLLRDIGLLRHQIEPAVHGKLKRTEAGKWRA
ncbi:DUF1127 domain-containing protein [Limibacillus halophilus]|uniref:Uncharacterized protein YjiS (DUF1127 family) n=1 Tax=Limibacillus halophilus TaxID=1579333 RepID=A0A839T0Z2_9PROT|nr:DUF1127 domain-containing protein [Limibacillus halophilus]MBB3066813.1 uncharacterized protein YjiS (DUF1127 family) [Limibacillus halophilus]